MSDDKEQFQSGDAVYVVDKTHAWQALYVGHAGERAYVQIPGREEYVAVDPATLRKQGTGPAT